MIGDAAQLYGEALLTGEPLHWVTVDGRVTLADVSRWRADADPVDRTVTDRCSGPVLDIGCGPGRILAALTARGVEAAGVDISPHAVALARELGGTALCQDVFAPLPAEGTWASAVLLDGNIGIGGDPARLLGRMFDLLAGGGSLFVETHPRPDVDTRLDLWLAAGSRRSETHFPWAMVGASALHRHAALAGFDAEPAWTTGGRTFVELVKPAAAMRVAA